MDLLTRADLTELAGREDDGVHLSLFLPTHRSGSGVEADQIRWKNAVDDVETVLAGRGLRRPDIEQLLEPARTLQRDPAAWWHMSDGLAMFLRPGSVQTFRLPIDVPALSTVGDRFVIGPLLPVLTDEHFLLLALSRRNVRLLEGTRHRVEEVVLRDLPTSLLDLADPNEPRSNTMTYPTSSAGSSGPASFYGHGEGGEFKAEELERYLRQVADGLRGYLTDDQTPLVLMGLEDTLSVYQAVSDHPSALDDVVRRNPDELSAEELHTAAWPVIASRLAAEQERVVDRFGELHGTGRASADPAKIAEAAGHGRIDTLMLATSPSCWEQGPPGSPPVHQLGESEALAHCELIDRIAVDTLTTGGRIHALTDTPVPGDGDIAAVFRY